jgi:hypothetical protein
LGHPVFQVGGGEMTKKRQSFQQWADELQSRSRENVSLSDVTPSEGDIFFTRLLAWCATLVSLAALVASIIIFGFQVIGWLQTGVWPPIPTSLALELLNNYPPHRLSWVGVQKIIDYLLDLSSVLTCLGLSFIVGMIARSLHDESYRLERKRDKKDD